ncbi:Hypothetical protein SFBmNL_01286 [Candidatus Arthromitus sp. SFB-mouse-NL]|uniref:hypothetical protein n=1 Tax=Candidatus Arthromitus sp. SFB-mouse-NL TaxID=1508644 RepID=UPI00049ACDCC|nr:hypothetical protein [Candidatus Arthromitus sp. SFB-mouse-NL]AID45190.1 Hypothetical protein SFBmNL_01286 [Candidatus Arthromitus sp. SFB-mouse-NL]
MRYVIKSTFIMFMILMSFVSCNVEYASNLNYGYYVGIISFNKDKRESFINQYDYEGNEGNRIKFSLEGISYLGDFVPSDDSNFYFKSNDIVSTKGNSYLIEVDKYTNGYTKVNLDVEDIYKIFIDNDRIYITHSLNKLSIYNKDLSNEIKTINVDDHVVGKIYIDDDNVYIFSRNNNGNSYLNVLDKNNLEIINKFNLSKFGLYQNDMFYYNGKIYFTNYDANAKSESGKIGIYDIYTETFDYINTISNNLDKILLYEDNIYVTVRGDNSDINKDSVIRIDRKTLKSSKTEFYYNIKVFDISEDKIFILSDKYLQIYNAKDFTLFKKIEFDMEENNVISGLILYG